MKPVKAFWTYAKAAKLLDEENSCCGRVLSTRLVPLMPKYIGKWRAGIREILNMDLGKYTEWLAGVLLGYSNMKLSGTCLPMDDQPYMHVNIQIDAIIFKPTIGSMLKCTVNEVAPDHISCLAHNYFNVSIPLPVNRGNKNEQRFNQLQGVELQVEIRKIHSMHGIISIQGKVPPDFENILANLPPNSEKTTFDVHVSDDLDSSASLSIIASPNEKRRKRKQSPCPIPVSSSDLDSSLEISSSKKKKKKKRKHLNEVVTVKLELGSDEDAVDKHGQDYIAVDSPRTFGSKLKEKKKKKLSADEKLASQHGSPKVQVKIEDQSMDSSTSEFSNVSDPFTPKSSSKKKKKKRSRESTNQSKDLDTVAHMKTEPDTTLGQKRLTPKSSRKEKQKHLSGVTESNGGVQMKTELEDGFELNSSLSKSLKKKKQRLSGESKDWRKELVGDGHLKIEPENVLDQKPLVTKSAKKKKQKVGIATTDIDNDVHIKTELGNGLDIKQEPLSLHTSLKSKKHKHRKSHVGK